MNGILRVHVINISWDTTASNTHPVPRPIFKVQRIASEPICNIFHPQESLSDQFQREPPLPSPSVSYGLIHLNVIPIISASSSQLVKYCIISIFSKQISFSSEPAHKCCVIVRWTIEMVEPSLHHSFENIITPQSNTVNFKVSLFALQASIALANRLSF